MKAVLMVVGLALSINLNAQYTTTQYITVEKNGAYRVGLNGQSDGYISGRNNAVENKFLIHSNGDSYFNGGNVGIGTQTPNATLEVVGNLKTTDRINAREYIVVEKEGAYRVAMNGQTDGYIVGRNDLVEEKFVISSNGTSYFNGGNVGIGTSTPNQKLTVNGTIYGKEVKVDLSVPGPDYVFEENYNLPSLEEIENYIDQHKHLPEVPSAKEMEANGINVGEMNMILLKKVEELTLHLIELKKENEVQQQEINELKNRK